MGRTTLASRIADKIHLDYIRGGRTPEGQSLPSVRALRDEYGASLATVSQALGLLEGRSLVRKASSGRCLVLDYKDPASSPALTAPIGLCLPEAFRNVMFNQVHEGVDLECSHTHHHVVVVSAEHYRLSDERAAIARLIVAGCRSVVLLPSFRMESHADTDYLNSEFQDVPVVLVDMYAPWHKRSRVVFDNRSLGFDLTRYLFGLGHHRVAIETSYGGTLRYVWPTNRDRYQGYLDAHALAGIRPNPDDRWYLDIRDPMEDALVDQNQVKRYLKR
jgi:DNA-binding LacI/PurR family transcriptional regulator